MAREFWHYHYRKGSDFIRTGSTATGQLQIETAIKGGNSKITFPNLQVAAVFLATAAEALGIRAVVAGPDGVAVRPAESK